MIDDVDEIIIYQKISDDKRNIIGDFLFRILAHEVLTQVTLKIEELYSVKWAKVGKIWKIDEFLCGIGSW